MKPNEYKCASCSGIFEKAWSDKEAKAERERNGWGEMADEDMAIICDDCYQKIMIQFN